MYFCFCVFVINENTVVLLTFLLLILLVSSRPVMLMQGSSDNVRIVLLRDKIEDSAVFQSVYGQVPAFASEGISSGPKPCHVCTKTVYPSERVAANGKVLHKTCFRCIDCKCTLNLSAYSFNKGKFYCNVHFTRRYQEKLSYDF
jgi:LIM domain